MRCEVNNKIPNIADEMCKLICAFEEHRQWRDNAFTFGVYTKVVCKPVFYVKRKVYDFLRSNSCLKAIIDENGNYGDSAEFMGIEVRTIDDNPKVADYALAFELKGITE